MAKLKEIEAAIQQVKLALDYLRAARKESLRVYSDEAVVRFDLNYATQELQEAMRSIR